MRKLNNKGFAISTLIYGLAIMGIMIVAILMATMAQTRSNTTNLVKSIEEDLNRFSRTETSFKPIGGTMQSQTYMVPESGWYKFELWGAQGGSSGGKGAYTSGVIELTEGEILYIYVGPSRGGIGGYATEVRIRNGSYDDDMSYETTIMAAAGGGTDTYANGGTIYGYNANMNSIGGYINSQVTGGTFSLIATGSSNPTNGSLIGFSKNYAISGSTNPTTGTVKSPVGTNGGGDGFYASNSSTTGGASYIAGYPGCYGIAKGEIRSDISKLEYYERKYVENETVVTRSYSSDMKGEFYFIDGMMLAGVRSGDGYAKIERVKPKKDATTSLKRKNTKLNSVRHIRECTSTPRLGWKKIVATVGGIAYDNVPTIVDNCAYIDLGDNRAVDDIAVYHTSTGVDYKQSEISVSNDGINWTPIKDRSDGTDYSETETVSGYKFSAYQYDSSVSLPVKGNYIIQPVLSENKVLTAAATAETNANPITIEPYNGEKRQKWSIELITDTKINPAYVEGNPTTYEYKITELSRFKSLSITQDENILYNTVSAINKFNEKARNEPQIWRIIPVGNGTYKITSVISGSGTGNLIAQTNNDMGSAYHNQIVIGKNNTDTARFKLIQIDYSSD